MSDDVSVLSLTTTSTSASQIHRKTATVQFRKTPYMFRKSLDEWNLRDKVLLDTVIIDVHFRGFTALNDVKPKDHVLE